MEDVTLQIMDIRALDVNEGDEHLVLAMLSALQTPFAGPDGQPVLLPSKITKVPMNKATALMLIESLTEAAENLPDPRPQSNLYVPGSPDEVDKVAQNLKQFGA